jgi:hypothetical protein
VIWESGRVSAIATATTASGGDTSTASTAAGNSRSTASMSLTASAVDDIESKPHIGDSPHCEKDLWDWYPRTMITSRFQW